MYEVGSHRGLPRQSAEPYVHRSTLPAVHHLPPTVFAPQASFGRGDSFITPVEPAVAMAHLRQAVAKTTVMVADGEAEAEAEADYERRFVELAQLGSPKGAAPTRAWAEAGAAE